MHFVYIRIELCLLAALYAILLDVLGYFGPLNGRLVAFER